MANQEIFDIEKWKEEVLRTRKDHSKGLFLPERDCVLLEGAMGVSGESGEYLDEVKKIIFHKHPESVAKLQNELGDVLWYVALSCIALGISFKDICNMNYEKLSKRYPLGKFTNRDSMDRVDTKSKTIIIFEGMDCTYKTTTADKLIKKANGEGKEAIKYIKCINEGSFEANMAKANEVLDEIERSDASVILLDRTHIISEQYLNDIDSEKQRQIDALINRLENLGDVFVVDFDIKNKETYKNRLQIRGDVDIQESHTLQNFDEIYSKYIRTITNLPFSTISIDTVGYKSAEICETVYNLIYGGE